MFTAVSVLAYWAPKWYGYLFRGTTWYAADQLMPAYAALVAGAALLALTGRYTALAPQWVILGLHTVVLLAAALFLSFFRMTRLF